MQFFRVLSRVAFICNICFVLTALVQYLPHVPEGEILSTIIVLGYFLSILINILLNLCLILMLFFGNLKKAQIPLWLQIVNFFFFVLQSVIIITSIHI